MSRPFKFPMFRTAQPGEMFFANSAYTTEASLRVMCSTYGKNRGLAFRIDSFVQDARNGRFGWIVKCHEQGDPELARRSKRLDYNGATPEEIAQKMVDGAVITHVDVPTEGTVPRGRDPEKVSRSRAFANAVEMRRWMAGGRQHMQELTLALQRAATATQHRTPSQPLAYVQMSERKMHWLAQWFAENTGKPVPDTGTFARALAAKACVSVGAPQDALKIARVNITPKAPGFEFRGPAFDPSQPRARPRFKPHSRPATQAALAATPKVDLDATITQHNAAIRRTHEFDDALAVASATSVALRRRDQVAAAASAHPALPADLFDPVDVAEQPAGVPHTSEPVGDAPAQAIAPPEVPATPDGGIDIDALVGLR